MGRVLVLLYFQHGLPVDMVIKLENSELCQPLDYSGLPFRCFRCHAHGHLANDCSLPFNKNSSTVFVQRIWKAKNCGSNLEAKEGKALEEISEDLNLSHQSLEDKDIGSQSSLSTLKPLCITSLSERLGWNKTDKEPVAVSSYDPVQNEALRDLGFVSPPKAFLVVSKGYFLCSVSKSIDGGFGSDHDPFGINIPVKGRVGVLVNVNHTVKDGSGELRALYASLKFHL